MVFNGFLSGVECAIFFYMIEAIITCMFSAQETNIIEFLGKGEKV